ncbi:hypothetical protein B0H14DRAFT_2698008, partial [Mycena olivaceomarginata]
MSFGFFALMLLVLPLSIEALPHDLTSLADASALKERRADQIIILCLIFSLLVYCIIFPVLAIIIGYHGKLPSRPSNRRAPPKISGSVPSQVSAPPLPQYVGAAAPLPPAAPEVAASAPIPSPPPITTERLPSVVLYPCTNAEEPPILSLRPSMSDSVNTASQHSLAISENLSESWSDTETVVAEVIPRLRRGL